MINDKVLTKVLSVIRRPEKKLTLSFTRKSPSGYTSFTPNMNASLTDDIWALIENNLQKLKKYEEVEYSPICHQDNTVEYCATSYVKNYCDVLESIKASDYKETEIDPDKMTFYCLTLLGDKEEENVYFFRRVTKFKKLSSEGFMAWFSGRVLNKISSKLLGIDGYIDIICYKQDILIFNHIAMERIFDMNDQFSDMAHKALGKIKILGKIDNVDAFIEDCQDDKRVQRMLAKMLKESDEFGSSFKDFEAVKKTIEVFDLDIDVDNERQQIIYRDKSQIVDILRFIRDAYYESNLRKRNGIDGNI